MKIIRMILGPILLFLDFVTSPRRLKRPEGAQKDVDAAAAKLTLYQFKACPFCIKVRRQMKRLNLDVEQRDAMRDAKTREELMQATGKVKVPVLRIVADDGSVKWLPDSSAINAYLAGRFAAST